MVPPGDDWAAATVNAFQALVCALTAGLPLDRVRESFDHLPEAGDETERLLFRYLTCELLLEAVAFGKPAARRDLLESILREWPSIRRHPQPVSVLRSVLRSNPEGLSDSDVALAGRVRELLERRYAERLLLRDIATELRVAVPRVNRCFRLACGSTVHQHLLTIRVRHGLALVREGAKIEAAALAIGFKSKKDFYRAVQRLVGCTPAQFRARARAPRTPGQPVVGQFEIG